MAVNFQGMVSTWRTLGSAATPQNIFTIENTSGSTQTVYVRRLVVLCDKTAVLTSVLPLYIVSRATGIPTGGTAVNKGSLDTAQSSVGNVTCRAATTADGAAATAITATAGDRMWSAYTMRLHTAVGQVLSPEFLALPNLCQSYPVKLLANQALLVQIVASAGSSNPATDHLVVNCMWTEEA